MAKRQTDPAAEESFLRLPMPERNIVLTSRFVADNAVLDRLRQAPTREPVPFTLDELDDLHRSLAVDAQQADDNKRRKALGKILDKIEEILGDEQDDDQDDDDDLWEEEDEWDGSLSPPASPEEMFQQLYGSISGPPASADQVCPITLGKPERETLLAMESMPGDVHKLLAVDSQEDCTFEFTPRQFLVTSLTVKESLESTKDDAQRQQLAAVARRISDGLFAALEEDADADVARRYRQSQGPAATTAFQLKITLEGSKPPIWRRVQVADCTLDVLHEIVQIAMGWENYHMHQFDWDGLCFSHPEAELDGDVYDETQACLSQLVADGCKKLRYWYDFGDDWWHTIVIEKSIEPKPTDRFPVCLKGVGACPPEDCGGIWGYYEFLAAIRDPKHGRHDEFVEWAGDFDPESFDLNEVNRALAH